MLEGSAHFFPGRDAADSRFLSPRGTTNATGKSNRARSAFCFSSDMQRNDKMSPELRRVFEFVLAVFNKHLQLPENTTLGILSGDDWSFVIRSHAVIEALVSALLATQLDRRLVPLFNRLELGDVDFGKLAFAKALGLLSSDQRRFISLLSTLRNKLAHNPKHLSFNFDAYFESLDKNQRTTFGKVLAGDLSGRQREQWMTLVPVRPRATFKARTFMTLLQLFNLAFAKDLKDLEVPPELKDLDVTQLLS